MARRIKDEILGICAILSSLYLGLCFISYDKWDPSFLTYSTSPAHNWGGVVGAYLADALISTLGIGVYAVPVFLFVLGLKTLMGRERHRSHLYGGMLFILSLAVLSGLIVASFRLGLDAGGVFGRVSARLLVGAVSTPGAYIFSLALFLTSLVLLSPVSIADMIFKPAGAADEAAAGSDPSPQAEAPGAGAEADAALEEFLNDSLPEAETLKPLVVEPAYEAASAPGHAHGRAAEHAEGTEGGEEGEAGAYRLPPLDLLKHYDRIDRLSDAQIFDSSSLLERKLADYAVKGRVTQVHAGPVVTMYEFEPAPGVKINRVVSLAEDLALALKAQSIRIAPVPGKAAIGIEVPNALRETVALREILSAESFRKSGSALTLALGKDIFGTPVSADLARMPHLLVAGATGSGKSVALNTMILSLLYRNPPRDLKLLMIDPKLLELSVYDGIPHLISPVVTNPKESSVMLRKMVFEMERRYRLIAEKGVRNIESFNASATEAERLPYLVIFIDELADLMLSSAAQVEDSIARLAQMARASGIHLVLATQRPSVDVITGVIKANFPARIAFQVTTRIDSRTIIDSQGAESLIGRGDMLFMLPGVKLLRLHGALVTEQEVKEIVAFCKSQGEPDFSLMNMIDQAETEAEAESAYSGDRDDLYYKSIEFAEAVGEVSISSIQRKLKVGYNRAARIMELMEEDGLVGPPKGAGKPRDFIGRHNTG